MNLKGDLGMTTAIPSRQPAFSSAPCYPVWLEEDPTAPPAPGSLLGRQFGSVLDSPPVQALRTLLKPLGQEIVEDPPVLWKRMPGPHLRVIFPVRGGALEDGSVVAVVTLSSLDPLKTLYAHPMHAGPGVNPLLAHLDGPMAAPKAQNGADGDRATRRMVEHKKALWSRFQQERETLGAAEASRRWRNGYFWALRRLYFCAWCKPCDWGSPFFDVPLPGNETCKWTLPELPAPTIELAPAEEQVTQDILASEIWRVETEYALRGGFHTSARPVILKQMRDGFCYVVFPMRNGAIDGGTLVALAVIHHAPTRKVWHAQCLSAGPEAEILYRAALRPLGLPLPTSPERWAAAFETYAQWRRDAWIQFWLDELEHGFVHASRHWLSGFWTALDNLLEA